MLFVAKHYQFQLRDTLVKAIFKRKYEQNDCIAYVFILHQGKNIGINKKYKDRILTNIKIGLK